MPGVGSIEREKEQAIREAAYFIWERAGRPEGCAQRHWQQAIRETVGEDPDQRETESFEDEEKVLAGRPDADMPALLTKDVRGG
jgi:hypothetical protein